MTEPEAAVFDCDGTLVDTETAWSQARTVVYNRLAHRPDAAFLATLAGRNDRDSAALITDRLHCHDRQPAIARAIKAELVRLLDDGVHALPGVHDLLETLCGRMPLAVASSGPPDIVAMALRTAGLDGYFRYVSCADAVCQAKPHPDTYLRACAELGVPARRAVALEDTAVGLQAARAAGLTTILVGDTNTAGPDIDHADLHVATMADPRIGRLLGLTPALAP